VTENILGSVDGTVDVVRRYSMPEVILELAEGRTLEQKRTIVKEFTDTIVRVCGVDREAVVVIIHENPRTDKAKGGLLFCDR
jgi:4-oxalocrotonate tautomerase